MHSHGSVEGPGVLLPCLIKYFCAVKLFRMFSVTPIHARNMPEKTLCLTFDDGPGETMGNGPGPKTLELARYLHEEKIPSCFFMTGIHLVQYPEIPHQVSELGHMIGNHSFTHARSFPEFLKAGWDIVAEIELTDRLIKKYNPDQPFISVPPG